MVDPALLFRATPDFCLESTYDETMPRMPLTPKIPLRMRWFQRRLRDAGYIVYALVAPFLWLALSLMYGPERRNLREVAAEVELRSAKWVKYGHTTLYQQNEDEYYGYTIRTPHVIISCGFSLFLWVSIPLCVIVTSRSIDHFFSPSPLSRQDPTASLSFLAVQVLIWLVAFMVGDWLIAQLRANAMLWARVDLQRPAERIKAIRDSRRAIVDAFEIERKRISRDLHDGAQQYLVAAMMKLGEAQLIQQMALAAAAEEQQGATAHVRNDAHVSNESRETAEATHRSAATERTNYIAVLEQLEPLLSGAEANANDALTELRRTVVGLAPQMLEDRGLAEILRHMVADHPADIELQIPHELPDLPDGIATTAYFLISEAITNAVKHSPNAPISVLVVANNELRATIIDRGQGGAQFVPGHGLAGLRERLAAFGGTLTLSSPPGGPTAVSAVIPLPLQTGESGLGGWTRSMAGYEHPLESPQRDRVSAAVPATQQFPQSGQPAADMQHVQIDEPNRRGGRNEA